MRRTLWSLIAVAVVGALAPAAVAQSLDGARAGVVRRENDDSDAPRPDYSFVERDWNDDVVAPGAGIRVLRQLPTRTRLRPFAALASLLAPGAGQFVLGKDRFIGYAAVEMLGWLQYAKDVRERASQERAYKDYARRVARANFTTTFPDAPWEYYEWMRDFLESGQFSKTTSGPVVPETDTTTFNGKRWLILLSTQPDRQAALAQYEREAIRPEYRWSWVDAQLQYDIYIRTTDLRNDAARAAVKDLLVIGANHFISMIDAFAALRLQVRAERDGHTSVGASVRW